MRSARLSIWSNGIFLIWPFLISLSIAAPCSAQNPINPPGLYTADPSARVMPDGRIYLYVSRDESPRYYCSHDYVVLSSADLLNWKVHPDAFASAGPNDRVPYSDAYLYAPDGIFWKGLYYLFYCLSGGGEDEGVAVSNSPAGPFGQARPIAGISQIDPCVFVDDDGQPYLVWGQFNCKIARLNSDLRSVDLNSIRIIATEKEHHFHEGAFMFKRQGIYYLLYADISRRNTPTCLGYATASSPLGPFTYRGIIIDNTGCDPLVWNNHGSVAEFKGRWYVFYHRSTHASRMMRKTCLEPINFTADGLIPEVEMTSQGAGPPLDAFSRIEAERACQLTGYVRLQYNSETKSEELACIEHGNTAAYKYLNFGEKSEARQVVFRLAPDRGGKVSIRIDQPWGPAIANVEVPPGDGRTWTSISAPVQEVMGVHPIWLHFSGYEGSLMKLDWFLFERK
ncbi:MAG: family 43 glycosylhydrolase [Candidatus Saccharicenans sp.]|nr:family 43 glycosylhydrolase [Candidatus Saccharicenans sp.]